MIVIFFIGFSLYFITILWLVSGFFKLKKDRPKKVDPKTSFSIVIPFRNEAENIPRLLKSLSQLNYPKELFEVFFINDASEDEGEKLMKSFLRETDINYQILQNQRTSQSPKKDAISLAVKEASHEWILTTDADCRVPEKWLHWYDRFIQEEKPYLVCGPVLYARSGSVLDQFQFFDGLSLQLVAMGSFGWKSPLLCNGANLAYLKKAFLEVNGFTGNDHIASGDDIFLLEKMKHTYPDKLGFLNQPETAVTTQPETTWKRVVEQRIRWASKTTKQENKTPQLMGAIVFLANLFFVISLICYVIPPHREVFLAFLFQKILLDIFALTLMAKFFNTPIPVLTILISIIIYPFLTIWIVLNSLRGSYTWKGRTHGK